MKEMLKYLGVFLVLISVFVLSIYAFRGMNNNLLLVVAGLFLVGGLLLYIILNKIID